MGLIYIKRFTKKERRYTPEMGMFLANVTYIKKFFLGVPLKTMHKYRETYYGKTKDCLECVLAH